MFYFIERKKETEDYIFGFSECFKIPYASSFLCLKKSVAIERILNKGKHFASSAKQMFSSIRKNKNISTCAFFGSLFLRETKEQNKTTKTKTSRSGSETILKKKNKQKVSSKGYFLCIIVE